MVSPLHWCPAAVVAVPSGLTSPSSQVRVLAPAVATASRRAIAPQAAFRPWREAADHQALPLTALAGALVVLPVFVQAPWVRAAPMAAALFTAALLAAGILLERHPQRRWQELGALLVGFSGSWLGGALFWGWCRLHPVWHLPIEAFALPLAVAGLGGRWRLAGCFYLASLLGTAATDAAMLLSGVIDLWPRVLSSPLPQAPLLLHEAAISVLRPLPLSVVSICAILLLAVSTWLWERGQACRIAAVTVATTLAVDGLFLAAALAAPRLSGLI
jgi:hypothetical protein